MTQKLSRKFRCSDTDHQWQDTPTASGKVFKLCVRCGITKLLNPPKPTGDKTMHDIMNN